MWPCVARPSKSIRPERSESVVARAQRAARSIENPVNTARRASGSDAGARWPRTYPYPAWFLLRPWRPCCGAAAGESCTGETVIVGE
jgi:hypothetical protein